MRITETKDFMDDEALDALATDFIEEVYFGGAVSVSVEKYKEKMLSLIQDYPDRNEWNVDEIIEDCLGIVERLWDCIPIEEGGDGNYKWERIIERKEATNE